MMGWLDGCCGFGPFGTGNWVGLILNLVVVIGLVIGFVLFIRWLVQQSRMNLGEVGKRGEDGEIHLSARRILDNRYARGEIDRDQYQQMVSDIS